MTTTSPAFTLPFLIPSFALYSPSKTRAGPLKIKPSLPVILATEPPVAKFPFKIRIWPVAFMGLSIALITS